VWDQFQLQRLQFELGELKVSHPHCEYSLGSTSAVARIWQQVAGSWYRLRVEVPGAYPDEKPRVYVESPVPLPSYWPDRMMSEFALTHNYHLLRTSDTGQVQICHFSDGHWDATKSIHLVVLKAKLWLQAYAEHHLRTGQPICDFFGDCT
jgi:hypothetical protein